VGNRWSSLQVVILVVLDSNSKYYNGRRKVSSTKGIREHWRVQGIYISMHHKSILEGERKLGDMKKTKLEPYLKPCNPKCDDTCSPNRFVSQMSSGPAAEILGSFSCPLCCDVNDKRANWKGEWMAWESEPALHDDVLATCNMLQTSWLTTKA